MVKKNKKLHKAEDMAAPYKSAMAGEPGDDGQWSVPQEDLQDFDMDVTDGLGEVELEDGAGEKNKDSFSLAPSRSKTLAPADPLRLYLREINKFGLLSPEEEHELALRVRDKGDSDAAFRLVSAHLRLVVKIAMGFQRRWMQNVLDLIQEGNVGLMRAVQKFDPDKGIKFSYYAAFWIKAYILKFIMDNWRMVKIGTTQAQRKLFYNLSKERQRLTSLGFDPDNATIAKNLGVTEDTIVEMDQRLAGQDVSLDLPVGEDSGGGSRMDFLPALEQGVEAQLMQDEMFQAVRDNLKTIVESLSDKEQDILEGRLLSDSPVTLREIGEKYGITRERVRQIETRLLSKLKKHLRDNIQDFSSAWIKDNE